jgi:hypothetical protein
MQGKHGEVISQKDLDELLDRSDLVAQFEKSKEKKQGMCFHFFVHCFAK